MASDWSPKAPRISLARPLASQHILSKGFLQAKLKGLPCTYCSLRFDENFPRLGGKLSQSHKKPLSARPQLAHLGLLATRLRSLWMETAIAKLSVETSTETMCKSGSKDWRDVQAPGTRHPQPPTDGSSRSKDSAHRPVLIDQS